MFGFFRFVLGGALWFLLVLVVLQLPTWFLANKNDETAVWPYVWRFSGAVTQVPPEFFQATFAPYLTENFWQVELPQVYRLLAAEPWFSKIVLERRWPPEILVTLEEKSVVAFWGEQLLSAQGEIFQSRYPYVPAALPTAERPARLPRLFSAWRDPYKFFLIFQRLQAVAGDELPILAFLEDERGSWEVFLPNGLRVILGQMEQEARFKTFVQVYQKFLRKEAAIAIVDMRYRNGFSVTWREESRNEKR
jgi:cell division protein FtsQ